jgi:hypothetical protein
MVPPMVRLTQPTDGKGLVVIFVVTMDNSAVFAMDCAAGFTRPAMDKASLQSRSQGPMRPALFRVSAIPSLLM